MKEKYIEIVILCGGRGQRMSENKQKCMLDVEGRPILEHLLDEISTVFRRAKVILLIGFDGLSIRDHFKGHYKNLKLEYASESTSGTREALLGSEEFIENDNFISLDGDTIVRGSEILSLVENKQKDSLGRILLSTMLDIAPTHGYAFVESGTVSHIIYPPSHSLVNAYRLMDTGSFSRKLFNVLKKYPASTISDISEVLKNVIQEGETIEAEVSSVRWYHFVYPEDLKMHINFQ